MPYPLFKDYRLCSQYKIFTSQLLFSFIWDSHKVCLIISCFALKVRTDRSLSFYDGDDNPNVNLLHDILLTYSFYNFDLGYCQVVQGFLL